MLGLEAQVERNLQQNNPNIFESFERTSGSLEGPLHSGDSGQNQPRTPMTPSRGIPISHGQAHQG